MKNENKEILLIELAGASIENKLSWRHSIYRSAPIGLYCLQTLDTEKIGLIDVVVPQIKDTLYLYKESPIKEVILRLAINPDCDEIHNLINIVQNYFPKAKIGCNYIDSEIINEFDFSIKGTGKTALNILLKGEEISGIFDKTNEDLNNLLSIPQKPLIDVGYSISSEKWLNDHSIEIWQPWLGLSEFSTSFYHYPGNDWIINLLKWLIKSGFNSYHFNPSKWTVDEINLLRPIINNFKINLSLSFNSSEEVNYSDILIPIKRIWLYEPHAKKAENIIQKLKNIKSAGSEACLQINYSWFGNGSTLQFCKYIDHLVISDSYSWSNKDYKKFIQRFWGSRNRFFRRLIRVRSASELVVFLKSVYELLDILFLPDNKGEKQ